MYTTTIIIFNSSEIKKLFSLPLFFLKNNKQFLILFLIVTTSFIAKGQTFALSFDGGSDGDDDYIENANFPNLPDDWTVEYFLKINSYPGTWSALWNFDRENWTPWIGIDNNGNIEVWDTGPIVEYPTGIAFGTWYHVAISKCGTDYNFFIDGTLIGTYTGTITAPGGEFTTGASWYTTSIGDAMDGEIDEMRVSDDARYCTNFTPPVCEFTDDASTIALYHFDEGTGQTAADASGNGHDLQLGSSNFADGNDPEWVTGFSSTTVAGDIAPPQNSTGIDYSTSTLTGAFGYNWTVPAGATITGGQGTSNITVDWGTTDGDVCVEIALACGTATDCFPVALGASALVPPDCGDVFSDTGGTANGNPGNYSNNEDYSTLICPDNPGDVVTLTFTSFDVEDFLGFCIDVMNIFDGDNAGSPQLGQGTGNFCGTTNPGPFTSTDASGCLFVTFFSDGSGTEGGWEATISCAPPCSPPSNDDCSGAIPLIQELNANCANPTPGTVDCATFSGPNISCSGGTANPDDDVWYSFEAMTSDPTIDLNADFDGVIELFGGDCADLINLALGCIDATSSGLESFTPADLLTPGNIYFIRIYDFDTGPVSDPTFDICVYGEPDDCGQSNTNGEVTTCDNCTPVNGVAPGSIGGNSNITVDADGCGPVTLTIEYSFNWNQGDNLNWIHGVSFTAGPNWTASQANVPAGWVFVDGGVSGLCNGNNFGSGFFFEGANNGSQSGDTSSAPFGTTACDCFPVSGTGYLEGNGADPSDNWGVNCSGGDCPTFSFDLTFCPPTAGQQTFTEDISFTVSEDGASGAWCIDGGCTTQNDFTVTINNACGENPDFEFDDFCEGQPNGPTNISSPGGTFAFNPNPGGGVMIDPTTGVISGETAGDTYTVEYSTPGVCVVSSSTQDVTVTQPPMPTDLECWETATFVNTMCMWEVSGVQDPMPTNLECWETATFNDDPLVCAWEVSGVQDPMPTNLECWETATFNDDPLVCAWEVSGAQDPMPTNLECWETATFNDDPLVCAWEVSGVQDPMPTNLECWETATFNDDPLVCAWEVSGVQDPMPTNLECWETATFNDDPLVCAWEVSGVQDPMPTNLECWETATFNDDPLVCAWEVSGVQDPMPTNLECWETATFNDDPLVCAWEVSGVQDPMPTNLECWETATFNDDPLVCAWEVSGAQDPMPTNLECWETATFNDDPLVCAWEVSGVQDPMPTNLECWETATFNDDPLVCAWEVSGVQDPMPTNLECWETATFNDDPLVCAWEVSGVQDPMPTNLECWETATFNDDPLVCAWEVSGVQDPMPTNLECWETATFNDDPLVCAWEVSGVQDPMPTNLECWETATFNDDPLVCAWEVSGVQDPMPTNLECWETATFNDDPLVCAWEVSGVQDPMPTNLECWETATFNDDPLVCAWEVSGVQDPMPTNLECWETATFNDDPLVCAWEVSGVQDPMPTNLECWETATFNDDPLVCAWEVSGVQDPMPTNLECWETATFNDDPLVCAWEVSGVQDPMPTNLECWETATFNDDPLVCAWEVSGVQDPMPTNLECWETATFNDDPLVCAWEVSGVQDPMPTNLECWETATFNDDPLVCAWEVSGAQDPMPTNLECWETATFNDDPLVCAWEVSGVQDPMPTNLECWETATFNDDPLVCAWEVSGVQDPMPTNLECWETATFNDDPLVCAWEVSGVQDPMPTNLECWETATFNDDPLVCAWEVSGVQDPMPTNLECWETATFNDDPLVCAWEVSGVQDPMPTNLECWETATFNDDPLVCAWEVSGVQDPMPTNLECWETATFNDDPLVCAWEVSGVQDPMPTNLECWETATFNDDPLVCAWEVSGVQDPMPTNLECWETATFNDDPLVCAWEVSGAQDPMPTNLECWETATFNDDPLVCAWEVSGAQDPMPTNLECWETATFNDDPLVCAWEVSGAQDPMPTNLECWETATFNDDPLVCAWEVSGAQDPMPTNLECWETATFNDDPLVCAWEVSGVQDPMPTNLECWETATFNDDPLVCAWEVSGVQDPMPTNLECWETATFNDDPLVCAWEVSGNPEDASFMLTNFCEDATNSATIIGMIGGTFTITAPTGDGATINDTTGEISNGVGGTTYTIEYITNGPCPNSSQEMVTVNPLDDTSFSLTDFCLGATNSATITGIVGGAFTIISPTDDGAIINGTTGELTNEVAGTTYTIEYTTNGQCPDASQQMVMVSPLDDASFSLTDFCEGTANSATITGTTGGTFTIVSPTGDGAMIDATGEITNGVGGTTYTIDYVTSGICSDNSEETVTVFMNEDATFTMDDFCFGNNSDPAVVSGTPGGIFSIINPIDAATINSVNGTISNGQQGVTYTIQYQTPGGNCSAMTTENVTVLDIDLANASIPDFCANTDSDAATIIGASGGTFDFNPLPGGNAMIDMNTGVITNATAGTTYMVDYTTPIGGCQNTVSFTTTAQAAVFAGTAEPSPDFCEGATDLVDLTALLTGEDGGGSWNSDTDPAIDISNPAQIDISTLSSDTYNFTYTVTATAPCLDDSETVSIIINALPVITDSSITDVLCNGDNTGTISITVTGNNLDYDWTGTDVIDGQTDQTNLSAGNYSVLISDTNTGCSITENFTIAVPDILLIDCTNPTNETVANAEDGTITLVFSGGTPPYSISYTGNATGTTDLGQNTSPLLIEDLAPDGYTVTITDDNGCTQSCTFTINPVGCDLSLDNTTVDVNCADELTGSIDLTVLGNPDGVVSFNWSSDTGDEVNGQEDQVSLGAGTYQVTVSDAANCSATATINITEPLPIIINNVQIENANCNLPNGSIQITASGGTGVLEYSIDNGNTFFADNEFINQAAGDYDIIVQDENGCQVAQATNIPDDGTPIIDDVIITGASCGLADGMIEIIASGGFGNLTYELDLGGATANNVFSDLSAGNHDIIVTDENGCAVMQTVIIPTNPAASIDDTELTNSTCGAATGSIIVTASGTGIIQYSITGVGGLSADNTFIELTAGTYTVLIEDEDGCQATESVTIIDDGSPSIDNLEPTPATCGQENGSLTITASGGIAPLSYELVGIGQNDTGIFNDLAANNYDVIVTDDNDCQTSATVVISGGALPIIDDLETQNATCGLDNGTITVNASGGTAPLMYSINGGVLGTDNVFMDLADDTYTILVEDAAGCQATQDVTLDQIEGAIIDNVILNPTTCGLDNGSLEIIATNGTMPYLFSIGNGYVPTATFNNLPAGAITVEILDDNNCSTSQIVMIETSTAPVIDDVVITPSACDLAIGALEIQVSAGIWPYTYSINSGAYVTDSIFTDLAAGLYDISVLDANNCEITTSSNIGELPPIMLNCAQNTPVSTVGGMEGSADIDITGGTAPFLIQWDNAGMTDEITNGTNGINTIVNLTAGNYDVTVTDDNGCTKICNFTINGVGCDLSISDISTNVTCNGDDDGTINVTIADANGLITYAWTPMQPDSPNLADLPPGTYNLLATDDSNCEITTSITITEPNPIVVNCFENTAASVANNDGIGEVTITGGTPPYDLDWGIGILDNQLENDLILMPALPAGDYTVVITDANGCIASCDFTINGENCDLTIDSENFTNATCFEGADGTIDITASTTNGNITYTWIPDVGNSGNLTDLPAGTYELVVTDDEGCSDNTTITIGQPTEIIPICGQNAPASVANNDGIGEVTITGGTPPYDLDWGIGILDNQLENDLILMPALPAGDYTVVITDANGCMTSCDFTINGENCDLTIDSENFTNATCFEGADGTIDITASTTNGNITYTWIPDVGNSGNLTDLPAGTYELVVTDDEGCSDNTTITIGQPTEIIPICGQNAPASVANNDGIGEVTITGGTPPYDLDWGIGILDNQLENDLILMPALPAGDYTVVITDANGCMTSCDFTINGENCDLTIDSENFTNATCFEGADGTIDITASTTNGNITYTWIPDVGNSGNLTDLPAGTYELVVTDDEGCSDNTTITIGQPTEIIPICGQNAPASVANNDGIGEVNITGGTPPYDLDWGIGILDNQLENDLILMPALPAGDYTVVITDANGCIASCDFTINGENCDLTIDSENFTNATCFEGADGTIDITASTTNGNITYTWIPDVGNSGNLTDLPAGTYELVVTDDEGCSDNTTIIIGAPTEIIPICGQNTPASVANNDGIGEVTITGGTPPYDLDWGIGILDNQLENDLILMPALPAGDYTVVITDANGCIASCDFTINGENCDLTIDSENFTNATCFEGADGTIDITASTTNGNITYTWIPDVGNSGNLTDLPAGTYELVVTDDEGCSDNTTITIGQPTEIIPICGQNAPASVANNDGIGEVTITGGTPPYDLDWGIGILDNQLENDLILMPALPAGDYTVVITDANGCIASCDFTINGENCDLTIDSENFTNATCFEGADGTIDITASTTNGNITYTWIPDVGNSGNLTDLPAGTYELVVTDDEGCSDNTTITIGQPTEIIPICGQNAPASVANNDGIGEVTITGGTPPYDLDWGIGILDNQLENDLILMPALPAGDYTVVITDANGCIASCDFTINGENCDLTIDSENFTNATCFEGADGTIDITASTTNGNITYTWIPDVGNSGNLTDLPAGTYELVVTDDEGCSDNTTITIGQPTEIIPICGQNAPASVANNDGIGEVTITGGTPPYDLDWGIGTLDNQLENDLILMPALPAGDYTVVITDANGCIASCDFTINGENCDLTIDSENFTNATCFEGADGTIDITASTTNGNITYTWIPDVGNSGNLTDLPAGTYELVVTDDEGCSDNTTITIGQPTEIIPICGQNAPASVANNDGIGEVTITGGTPPYDLDWGIGILDNQLENDLILMPALPAGDYTVVITDANGCIASCDFTINGENCDLTIDSENFTNATCFEGADGTIDITASTTNGNITYTWIPDVGNSGNLTDLPAGTYELVVTDDEGCSDNTTITIGQPLEMSATTTTNDICAGTMDGVINFMVNNGSPTYDFAWNNGGATVNGSGTTIDGLVAGMYNITVTDANGCTALTSAMIEEIGAPTAINVTENCNQTGSEYTISFTITGGDANSYVVTGDAGILMGNTFTSDPIADNTIYNFVVDDANGCNPFTVTGAFDCPDCLPITFDLAVTSEIDCNGDADGVATVSNISANAQPVITYSWSNGDQLQEAENLTVGWAAVTITDAIGCFGIDSIFLDEPAPLMAQLVSNDSPCFGENNGSILFENVDGGTAPYTYSIDGVNFFNQTQYNFLSPGIFQIAVEDANGCMFEQDMSILEPDEVLVNLGLDTIINLGDSILITPNYGSIVVDTFIWLGVDCINCPEVTVTPTQATTISLTIESLNGCLASDALFLGVNTKVKVFLPNVFSPNNDGVNDSFYPQSLPGVKEITEFAIFDRWGEQLFQISNFPPNDANFGWDGMYKGKLLNPQVCVWYCEVELTNGRKEIVKGDVTIIR